MKTNYNFKVAIPISLNNIIDNNICLTINNLYCELTIKRSDNINTLINTITKNKKGIPKDSDKNHTLIAANFLIKEIYNDFNFQAHSGFKIDITQHIDKKNNLYDKSIDFAAGLIVVNEAHNSIYSKVELVNKAIKYLKLHDDLKLYNFNKIANTINGGLFLYSDKFYYRLPIINGIKILIIHNIEFTTNKNTTNKNCGEFIHGLFNHNFDTIRRAGNYNINNTHKILNQDTYNIIIETNPLVVNFHKNKICSLLYSNNIDAEKAYNKIIDTGKLATLTDINLDGGIKK